MDYSKWDKWAEEVSDSDDDTRGNPVVTKFDGPAKVTFGQGDTVAEVQGAPAPAGAQKASRTTAFGPAAPPVKRADSPVEITEIDTTTNAKVAASSASSGGGGGGSKANTSSTQSHTESGGLTNSHYWSQTKDSCTVRLFVPPGTRGRDVRIKVAEKSLEVELPDTTKSDGSTLKLGGQLAYAVVAPKEVDDIDWELEDDPTPAPRRLLRVFLKKKSVAQGVVQWWSRVFSSDPEIDVTKIAARKPGASVSGFQDTWAKAHEMFKQKVAGIVKTPIDCD